MSERLKYIPAENPEDEPAIRFGGSNGAEILGTRENTRLFTFLGRAAFNHIFLTLEKEGNVQRGHYIWAVTPENELNPNFDIATAYMFENDYPCNLNSVEVPEWDVTARETYLGQSIAGEAERFLNPEELSDGELYLPDDW